jgi:nitrate/TMAO reductase-like tetraheme cytochrome c subunit
MGVFKQITGLCSVGLVMAVCLVSGRAADVDQCVQCHQDPAFRVQNKKLFDYFLQWKGSVHDEAGVSCNDCHGGDPSAPEKGRAHEGVLRPTDEKSRVFYQNIPKTCGECHAEVYGNFIQSRHYQVLMDKEGGPNCVTCHGSLNSEIFLSTPVVKTCSQCHNAETGNHPEIVELAERILHRMNVAGMYRKRTTLHYDAVDQPEVMKPTEKLYVEIARSWHQFDFEETDRDSEALLLELRSLYNAVRREERAKASGQGGAKSPAKNPADERAVPVKPPVP